MAKLTPQGNHRSRLQSKTSRAPRTVDIEGENVGVPQSHTLKLSKNKENKEESSVFRQFIGGIDELINDQASGSLDLKEKLAALLTTIGEKESQELREPITDWETFKIRLRQMKSASKRGNFDTPLKEACYNLQQFLHDLEPREESEYWKARTLLYELNDIFHIDPAINQRTFDDGAVVFEELREIERQWDQNPIVRNHHRSEAYRGLIKEKVLFCACRGNEMKRRSDTNGAGKLFICLLAFTTRKLNTRETPCFGTRAYLSYHLASIYRILEDHNQAERMYTDALNFYYERAKSRRHNDEDDFFFTTRRIAMCIGLGFGWINLTRGHLHRAENALTTARSLLARIPDSIVAHYIELLYGTIRRCRAGKDPVELREAIHSLDDARRAFKRQGHVRYEARASWELALAFNLIGEFNEANKYLKVIEDYAKQEANLKWQANIHILRSRIQRTLGNHEAALNEAQTALQLAGEEILPSVDALITRGEAYLYLPEKAGEQKAKYAQARADFQCALEKLQQKKSDDRSETQPTNPKIAAVCELRIAQCYARTGDEREAKVHFESWRVLRSSVEHKWVRELAAEVRAEIVKLKGNFFISSKDHTRWNYFERVAELQQWLSTQALRYTKHNWTKAAELIGVSAPALHGWRRGSTKEVKRAAGSRRKTGKKQTP